MNIQYDVELPERRKHYGRKKSEEMLAIEQFLKEDRENMRFEYESEEEAKKKLEAIRTNRRRNNCPEIYDLYRVENCIYIIRLKPLKGTGKQVLLTRNKENAPAGIGVPNAGAKNNQQIQNTPGSCKRQAVQGNLADTARRIEGNAKGN